MKPVVRKFLAIAIPVYILSLFLYGMLKAYIDREYLVICYGVLQVIIVSVVCYLQIKSEK